MFYLIRPSASDASWIHWTPHRQCGSGNSTAVECCWRKFCSYCWTSWWWWQSTGSCARRRPDKTTLFSTSKRVEAMVSGWLPALVTAGDKNQNVLILQVVQCWVSTTTPHKAVTFETTFPITPAFSSRKLSKATFDIHDKWERVAQSTIKRRKFTKLQITISLKAPQLQCRRKRTPEIANFNFAHKWNVSWKCKFH